MPTTIPAVAPTNCVVWIHSTQIQNIVFLPHSYQCIQQTFGNVSRRVDMYYVDHSANFTLRTDGEYTLDFEVIEHRGIDGYNMFGHPTNSPRCYGYTSFSERTFESIAQITRLSDCMLVKTGKVNRQVSKKMPMPIEASIALNLPGTITLQPKSKLPLTT